MKNKVQLITYPDSLGKDLKELNQILRKELGNKIGGVHILPFYPSSGDRGFSVLTHLKVDSQFGNWQDIKKISQKYEVMTDLMVNHISRQSEIFQDFLRKGPKSKYRDYFITASQFSNQGRRGFWSHVWDFFRKIDKVFHYQGVSRKALEKIYRPRQGSPFQIFNIYDNRKVPIWCTFSRDQIDLNLENPKVRQMLTRAMGKLSGNGVDMLRLDAVGYSIKRKGTSCFMIPETYELVSSLGEEAHRKNLAIVPEVRGHYSWQIKLASREKVDYVYDFCLPALVLHSLYEKNFQKLKKWIKIRPDNQVTVLDTHDGIGIVDVEGFLGARETEKLIKNIYVRGGEELVGKASGENSQNVDNYQINTTFFSALGESEFEYLLARAIQFFVPGIPQVYYVGWLVGVNDREKFEKTGVGRDLNRHNYTWEEIRRERQRRVVKNLEELMEFRNSYPAFSGKFTLKESSKDILELEWSKGKYFCRLFINLKKRQAVIRYRNPKTGKLKNLTKFS